ncbi:helix-turn-helix domain-containing protein [Actinacidiphila sp. ITFR-21]|uniref:helix-turn-helix domain-containing protein n=1 Tax=Actinacidiphila sp. ITFR-21 TaxID=3075199 RepID=UPI00288A36DE|nr:helix-turn-helix domain-containing protein [Streptomyces sp. ITFR-21]WNI14164.1 helix-turn-helix domain-containing protein [Streptomyces sp. ITFR-21]
MRNDLLLALRTQRGWTQEELSERSGISVRTIRNLERGRVQSPRRSSLDLLFSVLDPELRGAGGPPASGTGVRAGGGAARSAGDPGRAGGPGPLPRAAAEPAGGPRVVARTPARWRGPRAPRTTLVGREREVDELCEIVTGHPVTVLTGPGGIGKSRLALAVAERTAAEFPGGIAVAQLGRVAAATAANGGAGGFGGGAAAAPVFGTLGGDGPGALAAAGRAVAELLGDERQPPGAGPGLLVLDTAEHLPQTTALLVEQLRGAWPDLRIVVTTRRPPVLAEARIWETGPLTVESAVQLMSLRLACSSLTDDLAGSPERVRELCRELDCVPRLIEFAAYWLRSIPVSALFRPDHVLELLGVPDVSALPHQRSMRGSLEWSWGMLSPRQRQFLVRISDSPEPLTSDGLEPGALEPEFSCTEAVCLLAELADASLLQVRRGPRYEYRMLRHVRAFVRNRAPHAVGAPRPAAVRAAAGC